MLKTNIQVPGAPTSEADHTELKLSDLVAFFQRQWRTISATVAAALMVAGIYILVAPPQYTAKTQLMIDSRKVQPFAQQAIIPELALDTAVVESQVEVLRSEAVRLAVAQRLNLSEDLEFVGEPNGFMGWATRFLESVIGAIKSFFISSDDSAEEDDGTRRVLNHLGRNLDVWRIGRTYVLEISYRSSDKAKAAKIANAFAEAYIMDLLKANFDATKRASDWLQDRLAELRDDVMKADRAVQDYVAANNLMDAGSGRTLTEQQLGDVNTQLIQARGQVAEAKARLDRILAVNDNDVTNPAVTDALNNQVITKVRDQYLAAVRREVDFSARYGSNHPAVVDLRKEIEQLRNAARDELRRIAEAYRSDYEIAKSRQESLEASLKDVIGAATTGNQAGVSLRMLESSAQSYRRLYDSFLQRFTDAVQQQSFPRTEARVITPARLGEKSHPKTLLVIGAAMVLGLFGGVGVAFAREQLDHSLKTARQVEELLGAECLGIVPELTFHGSRRKVKSKQSINGPLPPRSMPVDLRLERHSVHAPFSALAESLRRIKVAADMSTPDPCVLGVVSTFAREGKSTIAVNLAHVLAHSGDRTLLIDSDLRRPALTRRMTPGATAGLVQVLESGAAVDNLIWQDPISKLDFLPAIIEAPIAHTAALLSSPAMEAFLAEMRGRYRYIVLDLPPLAPVVDAMAVSDLIDKFVLVVEWGRTVPAAIQETLGSAEVIQSRLLGAVLNRVDMAELKRIEPDKYEHDGFYNRNE